MSLQVDGRDEQSLTCSECCRDDEQPILVDRIGGGERMDDARAPEHDDVVLTGEIGDPGDEFALEQRRVVPGVDASGSDARGTRGGH